MANPYVREVGKLADMDGRLLPVGIDYYAVTIGNYRLTSGLAEEFARLFMSACWMAGQQTGARGLAKLLDQIAGEVEQVMGWRDDS